MKVNQILKIMAGGDSYGGMRRAVSVLPRYAAMCGVEIDLGEVEYHGSEVRQMDIPGDAVPKILALDFAERQSDNLRVMGEQIGRVSVSVPSNINVWQHLKGEAPLRQAANSIAEAAKMLTEAATR